MAEDWRPTAGVDALRLRARVLAAIRAHFAATGALEVETPILSRAGNPDANIASFALEGPRGRRWLRTSPEFAMKRLLAAGVGDCYELGRVFRRGESGRRHNPEFTMLEWYRVGIGHHALMDEVEALVRRLLAIVGREATFARTRYRDLFRDVAGVDPFLASAAELHDAVADFGICTDGLSRDDWLDLVLTHRIEPALATRGALFVHDFPPSQAALARIAPDADGTAVAQRFELYLDGRELANGYYELLDAGEQRARFERELGRRRDRGAELVDVDEALLAALAQGLPACSGVALGVDRLLMALLGTDRIDEVLAFPDARS